MCKSDVTGLWGDSDNHGQERRNRSLSPSASTQRSVLGEVYRSFSLLISIYFWASTIIMELYYGPTNYMCIEAAVFYSYVPQTMILLINN